MSEQIVIIKKFFKRFFIGIGVLFVILIALLILVPEEKKEEKKIESSVNEGMDKEKLVKATKAAESKKYCNIGGDTIFNNSGDSSKGVALSTLPVNDIACTYAKIIKKEAGKAFAGSKFKTLTVFDTTESASMGLKDVIIELKITNANRVLMLSGSANILGQLQKESSINGVGVVWLGDLVDVYGNVTEEVIATVAISRKTLDKVKWDSFNYNNLPKIADVYREHAVFSK